MRKLLFTLSILLSSSSAFAGVLPFTFIPGSSQAYTSNKGYAGLKWAFSKGYKPEAVIGFRSARIDPSNHTQGGDISISAKFLDGFELGKARLKYFNGVNTAQAEASGGYDFKNGIFIGASANGPFINAGVDYLINDKSFEPYIMLDSLTKYRKANASAGEFGCQYGTGIQSSCKDPANGIYQ